MMIQVALHNTPIAKIIFMPIPMTTHKEYVKKQMAVVQINSLPALIMMAVNMGKAS